MKMDLEARTYEPQLKGDVRRMRLEGKIPAVVYGHKDKTKRIYVLKQDFRLVLETMQKEAVTINLKIEDKAFPCLVKAIQHDPRNGDLLHIDFQHIQQKEKIKATVPIHLRGECPGIKQGGVLEQHLHEVIVRCLPDNLPSRIDVDISQLTMGRSIHLKDLQIPDVEFEVTLDTSVVGCHAPKVEKVAPKPVAEEGAVAEGAAAVEGAAAPGAEEDKEEKGGKETKSPKETSAKEPPKTK